MVSMVSALEVFFYGLFFALTSRHFYTSIKNVRKNSFIISPVFLLLLQIYDNQLLLSLMHSVSSSACS